LAKQRRFLRLILKKRLFFYYNSYQKKFKVLLFIGKAKALFENYFSYQAAFFYLNSCSAKAKQTILQ